MIFFYENVFFYGVIDNFKFTMLFSSLKKSWLEWLMSKAPFTVIVHGLKSEMLPKYKSSDFTLYHLAMEIIHWCRSNHLSVEASRSDSTIEKEKKKENLEMKA